MFTDLLFFRSCTCVPGAGPRPGCEGEHGEGDGMSDSESHHCDPDPAHARGHLHGNKWMVCSCSEHAVSHMLSSFLPAQSLYINFVVINFTG